MKCCNVEMIPSCIDDEGGEDIFVTEYECTVCGSKRLPERKY